MMENPNQKKFESFFEEIEKYKYNLTPQAPCLYIQNFIAEADRAFSSFMSMDWERREDAPRYEYYCNDFDEPYTYGRGRGERKYFRRPMPEAATQIRQILEKATKTVYEALFFNRYGSPHDHLGWHADDSPEMDNARPIAVVSLGAEREIWFRPKGTKEPQDKLKLGHGSLCLMAPGMQESWEHRIPKASFMCSDRISLTFRGYIKVSTS